MFKEKKGFTVIELMISITVIGIIMSAAIPNFIDFINKIRSDSVIEEFTLDIQMAKSLAISSNKNITFESGESLNLKNWTITQKNKIIKKRSIKDGDFQIFIINGSTGLNQKIIFTPEGYIENDKGATSPVAYISICDKEQKSGKLLKINMLGKIDIGDTSCV